MITKEMVVDSGWGNKQFSSLQERVESLMTGYEFIGYAKYLKWSMMAFAIEMAIIHNDVDGDSLKDSCLEYLENVWRGNLNLVS